MRPLLVLAALLTLPAPAHAATVSIDKGRFTRVAAFVAGTGERNNLTVMPRGNSAGAGNYYRSVTFADRGAVLRVGKGCRQRSAHVAVCSHRAGLTSVESRLGDRADVYGVRARVHASYLRVWSETGADVLTGGQFNDAMNGGRGADRLLGGDGPDFLEGGRGEDVLTGAAASDQLIPGPGIDVIRCGTGGDPQGFGESDEVYDPVPGEVLTDACERATFNVQIGRIHVTPTPAPSAYGVPAFQIFCPGRDVDTPHCAGTLELIHEGRAIATASFEADNYFHVLTPGYTQEGRRLARRPRGVRARATLAAGGHTVAWTLHLSP